MSGFADFWTNIEGSWFRRHAYYSYVSGCFGVAAISRSRAYAMAIGAINGAMLAGFVWVCLQAIKAID